MEQPSGEAPADFDNQPINPFVLAKGNAQQLGLAHSGSMADAYTDNGPPPASSSWTSSTMLHPQPPPVPNGPVAVTQPLANPFSMMRSMSSPLSDVITQQAPMAPVRSASRSSSLLKTDVALRTAQTMQMMRTLSFTPTMPLLSETADKTNLETLMRSVVKVFCIHTEPNFSLPWQRKRQYNSTSSGFVVSTTRRWLLTNAHSVQYHTQVKVQKHGDDTKYIAKVLSTGTECDIALLTVEDDEFWKHVPAVKFGGLPRLNTAVSVVGYPVGGDTVSVTVGVVSRLEVKHYCFNSARLLAVQIDAAINSGNSGGPVFGQDNRCVGIAFESLVGDGIDGVGYIIPIAVVTHFLEDYSRNGRFTGFPHLGVRVQHMESAVLRRAHKLQPGQKGVLVRDINPTAPSHKVLKINDVIMRLDGVQVSNDGTVPFRDAERVSYEWLSAIKFVGDSATVEVLRDGEPLTLTVPLTVPANLVATHIDNNPPSFLVVAGLMFTPSCLPYLQSEYRNIPAHLETDLYDFPKDAAEEVVMLSQVLACDSTLGYEDIRNAKVLTFNGVTPMNIANLLELVAGCTDTYMRFELDNQALVVLDTSEVLRETRLVLEQHCIPAAMSLDLKAALPQVQWPPERAAGGGGGEVHLGSRANASAEGSSANAAAEGSSANAAAEGSKVEVHSKVTAEVQLSEGDSMKVGPSKEDSEKLSEGDSMKVFLSKEDAEKQSEGDSMKVGVSKEDPEKQSEVDGKKSETKLEEDAARKLGEGEFEDDTLMEHDQESK